MTETEKSARRWRRTLLIWAAALLLAGLIGCLILYRYLGVYEISRPEILMDQLMTEMDETAFLKAAAQNLDFSVTEFEDAQVLYRSYQDALPQAGTLSYTGNKSLTDQDRAVFTVRSGPSTVCQVELVPGENRYAFGRHDWKLGRVSSGDVTEWLDSATVKVQAVSTEEICLNSVPVSNEYLTEDSIKISDLGELEKRFETQPHFVEYTISPLYGEIVLTDGSGEELFPTEDSTSRTLVYDARTTGNGKLNITAPEDVTVTVGGVQLGKKDRSASSSADFTQIGAYAGDGAYATVSYEFDGLYSAPEVSAVDPAGAALVPIVADGGRYAFFYANEPEAQAELEDVARTYFDTYMRYTLSPFDMTYFYTLLQKTLWGTPLYDYIAQSQAAMLWAPNTSPEYRYLHFDNFHVVSDLCFVCTVEYDIDLTATTWKDEYSYNLQNAYELVFVREGNFWFASSMTAIGG